jgi:rod shape-determining protein MreB and related proteins
LKKSSASKARRDGSALFVGIDLGTSRSAVCSSGGTRRWVESAVGWPKDLVARRSVGQPIVFGEDCHRLRLALDVYRPLEHGVIQLSSQRAELAARELIKHLVELAEPMPSEPIYAVIGAPAEATAHNRQAIRDALSGLVTGLMIVSEPFTVAYALGLLQGSLIVDIGAGTTDLCLMLGTLPRDEDQRSLVQAGDFIDEQLAQLLAESFPRARFSRNMVRQLKEKHGFVGTPHRAVRWTVPIDGLPTELDVTEPLGRSCEALLPHLREALREMLAGADPEMQEALRQNVVLAGGTSQLRGLQQAVEEMLSDMGGCKVTVVDDPLFTGADGALAIAQDTAPEEWASRRP